MESVGERIRHILQAVADKQLAVEEATHQLLRAVDEFYPAEGEVKQVAERLKDDPAAWSRYLESRRKHP